MGGAAKSRLSSIPPKCAILLNEKSANIKIILVFRGVGAAAILQLSREDKIWAIFILQGFLRLSRMNIFISLKRYILLPQKLRFYYHSATYIYTEILQIVCSANYATPTKNLGIPLEKIGLVPSL